MEFIHVRSLEKYHPGYKDRELQWGKIFINMAEGDHECERLNEIDFARLIKMILLELRAKTPLPNENWYWIKKGFDIKKRPMSLTLEMLHNFLDCVTEESKSVCIREEKNREDKSRVDKRREDGEVVLQNYKYMMDENFNKVFSEYLETRKRKATYHAKELILKDLHKYDIETAVKMLEQSIKNGWVGIFELKKEVLSGKDRKPSQSSIDKYAGVEKEV